MNDHERKETEAEFKQRMWDTYVKPAWEEAYAIDAPRPWLTCFAILAVVGVLAMGVACLLLLTEGTK